MAVVTFKFDESYQGSRTLLVGGWLADCKQWKRIEKHWQKALAYENRTLPEGRKLSRYHAAQMNANDGEYKGWQDEGHRKLRLVRKFLKMLSNNKQMTAIACGIDLKALAQVFPFTTLDEHLAAAYILCMKEIIVEIAHALNDNRVDHRVALIHDHGNWDKDALAGYNQMIDDTRWPHRERFVSITPLTWRDDVGLQSADLIAYELMRLLDNTLWKKADLRPALRELLSRTDMVYGKYINLEALEKLKGIIDAKAVAENSSEQKV